MRQDIGERIKQRRLEMDVSAAELASRLSMSRATIHRYESGEIRKIKLPVIEAMARELSVNPAWLLGKSAIKEREGHHRTRHDLKVIMEDFMAYMETDCVTCCGKPMAEGDRQGVISMLEAMYSIMVNKYK